jgi:tetratricopeptide (TPR) repeat protein
VERGVKMKKITIKPKSKKSDTPDAQDPAVAATPKQKEDAQVEPKHTKAETQPAKSEPQGEPQDATTPKAEDQQPSQAMDRKIPDSALGNGVPESVRNIGKPLSDDLSMIEEMIKKDKLDDAITSINKLKEANPNNETLLFFASKLWYLKGNYIMAWKPLDEIVAANPINLDAYNMKGLIFESMKKYDLALRTYQRCIDLEPDSGVSWYRKGNVLKKLGRDDDAKKALTKAEELGIAGVIEWITPLPEGKKEVFVPKISPGEVIKNEPTSKDAKDKIEDRRVPIENQPIPAPEPKAETAFQEEDIGLLMDKALAFDKEGKRDDALLVANEILHKQPDNYKAQFIKIKYSDLNPSDKINNLKKYLEKNEGSLDGMRLMADLLIDTQKLNESVTVLEQIVDKYPREAESWKKLITTLIQLGRTQDAEEHYNNAHRFIPGRIKDFKPLFENKPGKASAKGSEKMDDMSGLLTIPGVSLSKAKILTEHGLTTKEDLRNISEEKLGAIPGIGEASAKKIKNNL